jgi:hypothetical protein
MRLKWRIVVSKVEKPVTSNSLPVTYVKIIVFVDVGPKQLLLMHVRR